MINHVMIFFLLRLFFADGSTAVYPGAAPQTMQQCQELGDLQFEMDPKITTFTCTLTRST